MDYSYLFMLFNLLFGESYTLDRQECIDAGYQWTPEGCHASSPGTGREETEPVDGSGGDGEVSIPEKDSPDSEIDPVVRSSTIEISPIEISPIEISPIEIDPYDPVLGSNSIIACNSPCDTQGPTGSLRFPTPGCYNGHWYDYYTCGQTFNEWVACSGHWGIIGEGCD